MIPGFISSSLNSQETIIALIDMINFLILIRWKIWFKFKISFCENYTIWKAVKLINHYHLKAQ